MGRGRPPMRRRVCRICMDRQGGVDWKAANFLRNFITELMSPAAAGPKGYLIRNGMDVLPETALRRSALKAQFARPGAAVQLDEVVSLQPAAGNSVR